MSKTKQYCEASEYKYKLVKAVMKKVKKEDSGILILLLRKNGNSEYWDNMMAFCVEMLNEVWEEDEYRYNIR